MDCGSLLKSNLIPDKEKMGKKDDGSLYKPDLLGKDTVTDYAVLFFKYILPIQKKVVISI